MKVCYVTHLPNLTGASQSLLDLLRAVEGTSVEPVVLLGRHGPLEEELKARGIPYKVIRYANELKKHSNVLHTARKDALNVLARRKIKTFFETEGIELVHNNSMFVGIGMECARDMGIPYIAHIRDYVEEDHGLKLEHPGAQSKRVRNASAAVAVSRALAKAAKEKYGEPATGIQAIYDAVDVDRYLIRLSERDLPLSHETVEVLLAGRIAPGKGQLDAAKAIAQLNRETGRHYHLTLVGSVGVDSYYKELASFVETLPEGEVTILPFADDLRSLRKQTDIALVCSVSEAMGRVTIESMLAGCLVVGANGGATPELLQQGRGELYEPGDIDDLCRAIRSVSEFTSSQIDSRVNSAQLFARRNFALKQYSEEILRLYREVLS